MTSAHAPVDAVDARTDADLVDAYRRGDVDAVGQLFDRYHGLIRSIAGPMGSPDVDEVVGEVGLALVEHAGTWSGEGPFTGWLARVTANAVLMQLRRRKSRRTRVVEITEDHFWPVPERGFDRFALVEELRPALAALSDEHRAVVALVDVADLDLTEVARRLGVAVGTVMSRHSRGLAALRHHLVADRPAASSAISPTRRSSAATTRRRRGRSAVRLAA